MTILKPTNIRDLNLGAIVAQKSLPSIRAKDLAREFYAPGRSRPVVSPRAEIDPYAFRVDFCDRWGALMQSKFRRPEEAAVFFDVSHQCAVNWLAGTHRPSGDKVAIAALSWPDEFAQIMGAGR